MAIDWTKVAVANDEVAHALMLNQKINEISPPGAPVALEGGGGDSDYQFPSTQGLINLLTQRRDAHMAAARAILNA